MRNKNRGNHAEAGSRMVLEAMLFEASLKMLDDNNHGSVPANTRGG
jgi:hypothetical protein